MQNKDIAPSRGSPLAMGSDEFRALGVQQSGEAYLSNAVIHGKYALRACIVNFRTSISDVEALLPIVVRMGKELDAILRPCEAE